MHLSIHWGVPSTVIRELPASEFHAQYDHWKQYKWGLTDDLLAQANVIAMQSTKVPWGSSWMLKDSALANSGFQPPTIADADEIWAAVDSFFATMES